MIFKKDENSGYSPWSVGLPIIATSRGCHVNVVALKRDPTDGGAS
jgi:hypothetical protein